MEKKIVNVATEKVVKMKVMFLLSHMMMEL